MPDFEDNYSSGIYLNRDNDPIDGFLNPQDAAIGGPKYVAVRKLIGQYADTKSLFDVPSGTRVGIQAEPADMYFTYGDRSPDPDNVGTIVTVKTANGNTTFHEGRLFVKWDSGQFGSYLPEHLKVVGDSSNTSLYRKAFNLDLTEFMRVGNSENELVHKASRDLWSFKMVDGEAILERLFDDNDGKPLKC